MQVLCIVDSWSESPRCKSRACPKYMEKCTVEDVFYYNGFEFYELVEYGTDSLFMADNFIPIQDNDERELATVKEETYA